MAARAKGRGNGLLARRAEEEARVREVLLALGGSPEPPEEPKRSRSRPASLGARIGAYSWAAGAPRAAEAAPAPATPRRPLPDARAPVARPAAAAAPAAVVPPAAGSPAPVAHPAAAPPAAGAPAPVARPAAPAPAAVVPPAAEAPAPVAHPAAAAPVAAAPAKPAAPEAPAPARPTVTAAPVKRAGAPATVVRPAVRRARRPAVRVPRPRVSAAGAVRRVGRATAASARPPLAAARASGRVLRRAVALRPSLPPLPRRPSVPRPSLPPLRRRTPEREVEVEHVSANVLAWVNDRREPEPAPGRVAAGVQAQPVRAPAAPASGPGRVPGRRAARAGVGLLAALAAFGAVVLVLHLRGNGGATQAQAPLTPPTARSGLPPRSQFPDPPAYAVAMTRLALTSGRTKIEGAPLCSMVAGWDRWTCWATGHPTLGVYAGRRLTYRCSPGVSPQPGGRPALMIDCRPVNPPPPPRS